MSAAKKVRAKTPGEIAAENPYRFFSFEEMGEIFDFGRDVMTAIAAHPSPPLIVARKMNPGVLLEWLKIHGKELGKIRPDKAEETPVKQNAS